MGEAKRRGTYEARKQAAEDRQWKAQLQKQAEQVKRIAAMTPEERERERERRMLLGFAAAFALSALSVK